jgi:hypothetical protein
MSDLPNRPAPPTPLLREQVIEWLDYSLEGLTERRATVLDAMIAMLEGNERIADESTAGAYAENVRMAVALERAAKSQIDDAKRPYLDGGRAVDGWRNAFMAPLTQAIQEAKGRLAIWEQYKVALQREEARKRADLAARLAEADRQRAEQAQAEQGLFSASASVLGEVAEASALQAMRAQEQAGAKAATLSRTTGHYGAQASLRTTWTYRVTSLADLPLDLHTHDDTKIKALLRQLRDPQTGRPTSDVPGLEWVEQQNLTVR